MTKTLEISEGDTGKFVPCDHCGHRSYFEVTLESGSVLNYCAHFYNKSQAKLWEVAERVVVRGNP